jgi:hypothetical protein
MGGKKASIQQVSTITPEQQQLLQSLIGKIQGGGYDMQQNPLYQQSTTALQPAMQGFDLTRTTEAFQKQVADPALQQFQQNILPMIQERYISQGAGDSSSVRRQMTQAGVDLQKNLSGQLAGALQQGEQLGIQNQLAAANQGYNATAQSQQGQLQALMAALGIQPFENVQNPGKASPWGALLGGAAGSFAGGAGMMAGANMGNKFFN